MSTTMTTRPPLNPSTVRDGGPAAGSFGLGSFGVISSDGPETIRARKYATGTHVLLQRIEVETGVTPREVVWTNDKARLYRYQGAPGADATRRAVPLLLVYGFVLKPYVLDLVPGNSLVEYLVGQGFDVYLLDFGVSGHEDAGLSLEDLVLDYLPDAVEKVLATSGAAEVSMLGQSQGGTLCAMYAALFPDGPLKNLVLLSAPTDFAPRAPDAFGLWTHATRHSAAFFDPAIVPRLIGNLPTDLASQVINSAASFQAAGVDMAAWPFGHPFGLHGAAVRRARELAERDVSMRSWLAVSRWVDDAAPFPARRSARGSEISTSATRWSRGTWSSAAAGWTFSNIRCALLNVSGKWDYVVPPCQTRATTRLASSPDQEAVALNAGHVGMLVGPAAVRSLWPRLEAWLAPRSG